MKVDVSNMRTFPILTDNGLRQQQNRKIFSMPLARLSRLISRRAADVGEKDGETTARQQISMNGAAMPDGHRAYVIGDIHGRKDLLLPLLDRIDADRARHRDAKNHLIFLGDYIDRGPMSAGVIDKMLELMEAENSIITLKGNHEAAMMTFLQDPVKGKRWLHYGGDATLKSYGVDVDLAKLDEKSIHRITRSFKKSLPDSHLQFIGMLNSSHTLGDYFFVHAGIDPTNPIDGQREHDLLWIRDSFLSHEGLYEKVVVHGHSIIPEPEFRENRIGIDTGAFYSNVLTCLVLEGDRKEIL
jgi:serine/threonine protein phosphatase 1|tara:strand:+ start:284 stop:1180 length:897 start_codon:yes stop_codon:yes gene_type:complete